MGKEQSKEQRPLPSVVQPHDKPFFAAKPDQKTTAGVDKGKDDDALSKIRTTLFELFEELDQKVVGDKEFDPIQTEEAWTKRKQLEKTSEEEMDAYKKKLKNNEIPPDTPKPKFYEKYTTCIDTQSHVLKVAMKRSQETIKKVVSIGKSGKPSVDHKGNLITSEKFSFATLGMQQAKSVGAWVEAEPGMSARPSPGDILILAKRIANVDKIGTNYETYRSAIESRQDEIVKRKTEIEQIIGIGRTLADLSIADKNLVNYRTKRLETAEKELPALIKKLEETFIKLEAARKVANYKKSFEFSHVSYFISLTKEEDGTERWKTFDGGQNVKSRGGKQGASYNIRKYDPRTNEISGEVSQGGKDRWLQGWIDVDKLVYDPYEG